MIACHFMSIKIISTKAFDYKSIRTINFPEDSEVQTIKIDILGASPNILNFITFKSNTIILY